MDTIFYEPISATITLIKVPTAVFHKNYHWLSSHVFYSHGSPVHYCQDGINKIMHCGPLETILKPCGAASNRYVLNNLKLPNR